MSPLAHNEQGKDLEKVTPDSTQLLTLPASRTQTGSAAEDDFDEEDLVDYPTSLLSQLTQSKDVTIQEKREDVRGRLAIIYTLATFLMFVLGFAVSILDALWRQVSIIDNVIKILPLISGIFLGSLGFVLGYYFRKIEAEDNSSSSTPLTS